MDALKKISLLIMGVIQIVACLAQEPEKKDTSQTIVERVKQSRVSRELLRSITRKPSKEGALNLKSEEIYLPFDGKIIRRVMINHIGFEKSITDTTRNLKNTATRVMNALHNNSKEWLIRDHLLFDENKPLNPYLLADNERFLRDLDFIVDARIYVMPLYSSEDSVDVLVVTRDVFSVGARFSPRSIDRFSFRVYDVNLMGAGQRAQVNGYYDHDRTPSFGYELYYRKSSLAGSRINLTAAYTQLNTGSSLGDEDETAFYVRLDRPLVSSYSHFAGGVEFSRNWSENFNSEPDSTFKSYRYDVADVWFGYNLGVEKNRTRRDRRFVSARYFDQQFRRRPDQPFEQTNPAFNSRTAFLGAFTVYRQEFYKTQYVYGFGRTEDVPYGHTYSLLAGYQSLLGAKRPYFGFDADKSFVHREGNFYTLSMRFGAFAQKGKLEDASLLISGQLFSKLYHYRRYMIRRTVSTDFGFVFAQRTNTLLDINGITYGLEGFRADSLLGTKRLHARYEMTLYTPWQLFGFHFAPLAFFDVAFIGPKSRALFYDRPFIGVGAGVRTRNENLVFGTIELKCFYYPRQYEDITTFKVSVTTNLRIKYSASFVRAPSFILYN